MNKLIISLFFASFFLFACTDKNLDQPEAVSFFWNFQFNEDGWLGGFADYPEGEEHSYELIFKRDTLPNQENNKKWGLKLSGKNHNNDLFMYIKKEIPTLEPNTVYFSKISIELATNIPNRTIINDNSNKIKAYLKAGGAPIEPQQIVENNFYKMNIDKANQNENGRDMVVIGNFIHNNNDNAYRLQTITNEKPIGIQTDEKGSLWIIIGIESVIDTTTTILIDSINIDLF